MGLDISSADTETTHRTDATPKLSGKVRPVFVRFVRCNDWGKFMQIKKLPKGTKVSITESFKCTPCYKTERS